MRMSKEGKEADFFFTSQYVINTTNILDHVIALDIFES